MNEHRAGCNRNRPARYHADASTAERTVELKFEFEVDAATGDVRGDFAFSGTMKYLSHVTAGSNRGRTQSNMPRSRLAVENHLSET
jgi:hypothetical protein